MKKRKRFLTGDESSLFRRIVKIMKLTTIILLASTMMVSASLYSQSTKVTLKFREISFAELFQEIESQTEFRFAFSSSKFDPSQKVKVDMEKKTLEEILDKTLPEGVAYEIIDRYVVIMNASEKTSTVVSQQQKTVSGKAIDSSGSPLPGVSIVVKGTTTGTITDSNGNYSLSNVSDNATFVFSFIGMKTLEIPIGTKSTVNVTMEEGAIGLEEVVAIGYGTRKKETLTGSVASVTSEKLMASPSLNVTNTISGLMPGVVTKQTSGEPGKDNPTILIRGRNTTGNNNPLVVVDGIQGVAGWERINSSDIESVSVLKDASAAIYGARAANGVILITTKRGALGKPVISYTFNQALVQPTRIPKMAESADFAEFVNQKDVESGQTPRYTDAEIQKFRDGSDPNYVNEDWYGTVIKKYSSQSQHNMNVRGGSENIKYSISGTYTDEGSMFKNGSLRYNTYALRSNVDAQITKNLKVGFDLNGALFDGDYPATYNINTVFSRLRALPMMPVYWSNGLPSAGIEAGLNPAVAVTSASGNVNSKTYRYMAKTSFDLTIPWVKGLGVDGYFAYTNNNSIGKNWQTPWTVYNYDKVNDKYLPVPGGIVAKPQLTQSFNGSTSTLVNLRIKYEVKINDHQLSTFIAAEQQNGVDNNFSAFRRNYLSTAIDELFAGSPVDQVANGSRSEGGRQNYFGRVSYGFQEKYLLDFTARYDGSSNFPKGKQYGFFPGVSAAWRISQENFMKDNAPFIDNLKLRGSVGKMGNDAIAAFQYLRLYNLGSNTGLSFGSTRNPTNGISAGVSPNPNITWEVATTTNIGLDASFWKGLLGITADVFKQRRSNILARRNLAIPYFTGLNLPSENIGVVENKGFELELSHAKSMGDFSWRIAGNISYSRNIVIDIDEAQNVAEWKKAEGHVIGAGQYYHAIGIFRTQAEVDAAPIYAGTKVGDLQYEDKDLSGTITANDMYVMDKTNIPEVMFGLNMSVNYKNFSLWANFSGATNVWQYLHVGTDINRVNLEDIIVNRYTPGSMDSKYPRVPGNGIGSDVNSQRSDFWLKDASYVRLKTLELSYNLPQSLLSKVNVQSMKLFVNGNNLFTIDNVKWTDPENSQEGVDFYPQSKLFNIGINLTF